MKISSIAFVVGLIVTASGLVSPPTALALGLAYAFLFGSPSSATAKKLTPLLLQASVVGLGFGMDLQQLVRVGRSGFVYTAISITTVIALGLLLGWLLHVGRSLSALITVGTAICGGSAIAAIGPLLSATEGEMAVSLGTVFILNSVALLLFPWIGWLFHLNETQFGLWAALAIHDTSSVVGASAKYGPTALAVGTTVKLARALWIVPLSIATAIREKSNSRIAWPWFILLFCLAAVANTYVPVLHPLYLFLNWLGRVGLTLTLYLIGASMSVPLLRRVGIRPLMQGLILWIIVAIGTLALIHAGWIQL